MEDMIKLILDWLGGGVVKQVSNALVEAYRVRTQAANDEQRIAADIEIQRLENLRAVAAMEAAGRWSATRIGRLLIVVPFGLWWAAIYIVQIINPWFGMNLTVIDVPAKIHDMALILIPAILLADAGALVARRLR